MFRMPHLKTTICVASLAIASCQNLQDVDSMDGSTSFDTAYIELGQEVATTHCSTCHNVSQTGTSQRADAPPLRTVLKHYNANALAEDFREHIHVGHPDMPDFEFTVRETEGLLAYLESIQETPD